MTKISGRTLSIRAIQLGSIFAFFLAVELGIDYRILPSALLAKPSVTILTLVGLFGSGVVTQNLLSTLYALTIAFVISAVVGILAGTIIGASRTLRDGLQPLITSWLSTPKVMFIPLLFTLLGFGLEFRLGNALIHGIPIITILIIAAIVSTDNSYLKVAKIYGASRLQVFTKIYLQSSTYVILGSIRLLFNVCLISIIFAELFAGDEGLGYLLNLYLQSLRIPQFFAIVYLIALISISVNLSLLAFERRLARRRGAEHAS